MKHRIAFILCILLCLSLSVLFVSCGGDNGDGNTPGDNTGGDGGNTDLAFTNVNFRDVTVDYDGNPHILAEVEGAPEGTTIVYTGRESRTDAGTYTVTAVLKDKNTTKWAGSDGITSEKTLTWTIAKKTPEKVDFTITGIADKVYDGQAVNVNVVLKF